MVIPNLSIAENIFISYFRLSKGVDKKYLIDEAKKYLELVGLKVNPSTKVKDLRIVEQQLIQFARALAENAKIICVDELTSALSPLETKHIFDLMRELKKEKSFIFITHRIEEVFQIADRVTVLREGMKILTKYITETSLNEVVSAMLGRDPGELYVYKKRNQEIYHSNPILKVVNLTTIPSKASEVQLKNISFDLYKGEILGVTGLLGAGKSELGQALVGMQKIASGKIILEGREIKIKSPKDAKNYGIFYLPEDRRRLGIISLLNIAENIVLPKAIDISKLGILRDIEIENKIADIWIKKLSIYTPSIKFKVGNLSGGNQQKIIVAKALELRPKILIFDEPTFGIDIGTKAEVRKIISSLPLQGFSIILLSSDVDEVLSLSDRIMVLSGGRIVKIMDNINLKREDVIELLR
jgi:ribose transport system ATP-binding protein